MILLIGAWLALTGCTAPKGPVVDYDPGFEMRGLRHFTVEKAPDAGLSDLDNSRIERAIRIVMNAKGYRYASPADFIVRYSGILVHDVPDNISFGFGIGGYGPHGGGSIGTAVTPTHDLLQLRIDMIDPAARRVFWSAHYNLRPPEKFDDPKARAAFFDTITQKVLKSFPTATKGNR